MKEDRRNGEMWWYGVEQGRCVFGSLSTAAKAMNCSFPQPTSSAGILVSCDILSDQAPSPVDIVLVLGKEPEDDTHGDTSGQKTWIISVLGPWARIYLHLSDTQNDLLIIFIFIVKWLWR